MRWLRLWLGLGIAVTGVAQAQVDDAEKSFPSKPIYVIVPYSTGTGGDMVARTIGQSLSEELKWNIVVDNRAGASGNIGTEIAKKRKPDGYSLLEISVSHVISKSLYSKLPYDLVKDFEPVVMVGTNPTVLVVNLSLPVNSVTDLIALAKAKPGDLNFSSIGTGSAMHLAGEMFNQLAGVKTIHVPYHGVSEALSDLITGRVQFMFATLSSSLPFIRSGKLKALAISSTSRHPALPGVPLMNETIPGFEVLVWLGFVAPAGTPTSIVKKLNASFVRVLNSKELRDRMSAQGMDPITSTPEEFGAHIKKEILKWEKVIKASDAKVD